MTYEDPSPTTDNVNQLEKVTPIVEALEAPLDEKTIKQFIEVEEQVFPPKMVLPTAIVEDFLTNPRSAIVVLKMPDGSLAGYIVADPLENAFDDLLAHDDKMEMLSSAGYIEWLAILSEHRSQPKNLRHLLEKFAVVAREKGYKLITMHARTTNGLSTFLQKHHGAKLQRRVENWYGFGEPFDYLVIEL